MPDGKVKRYGIAASHLHVGRVSYAIAPDLNHQANRILEANEVALFKLRGKGASSECESA